MQIAENRFNHVGFDQVLAAALDPDLCGIAGVFLPAKLNLDLLNPDALTLSHMKADGVNNFIHTENSC
ncbi:hypothetical protein D3C80_1931100 [compost metagenome]